MGSLVPDLGRHHQDVHRRGRDPHRPGTAVPLYHLRPPVPVECRVYRRRHLGAGRLPPDCHAVERVRGELCGAGPGADLVRDHGGDGDYGCRVCAGADFHPAEAVDGAADQVRLDVRSGAGECGCAGGGLSVPVPGILRGTIQFLV